MSAKQKIIAPESAVRAIQKDLGSNSIDTIRMICEKFAQQISENPIVPTEEDWDKSRRDAELKHRGGTSSTSDWERRTCVEWQRRMFLASEPEISEEIKDLLVDDYAGSIGAAAQRNRDVIEAYRRGKASR